MSTVLIASDLASLRDEMRAMLEGPDLQIVEAASGPEVFALLAETDVDLAILDLQIASMGAVAICLDLRHAESYGAMEHVAVLMLLDRAGVCCSAGSACKTGSSEASHVLKAMGLADDLARGTLRFGLGRFTTSEEVQILKDKLLKLLSKS